MIAWPSRRPLRHCATALVLLAAAGCGGDGQTDPSDVAEITLDNDAVGLDAAGQTVQLNATTRDADGNTVEVPVEWGSSDADVVTVEGDGLLVAQGPGTAEVTASVGSVSATATVSVNSTSTLQVFDGNGQTAPSGQAVPTPPAVRVADAQDQPVADVRITFQVATGSGTITEATQETDADGVARVGSWRVGSAGVNTLTASIEGADAINEPIQFLATTAEVGGFNITVRYLGEYTSDQLLAFAEAELRWESVVTGDLPDVNQNLPAAQCGDNPATNGPFDDVTIFVTIEAIDGPGNVLGQAGPCFIRVTNESGPVVPGDVTVIGRMQFDEDDVEALEQEGSLPDVILHEMGHVLGFGTLWTGSQTLDLLRDPAVPDPEPPLADTHFIGAAAIAAFDEVGGADYTGQKVPVMNVGGAGTVNSHWRDGVFDPEIMTGFLNAGPNPLSLVTIASLSDLGYTVDESQADPFTLNPAARIAGPRRGRHMVNDIISDPIRRVDLNGRIIGVIRR
jgi:Leishmanolysin/Bacterial Ig-like domain (group 2)